MKKLILISLGVMMLGGCAMKTKILDAAAVSMTRTSLKEGEKLQETGPVTGQFCAKTFDDKGQIGLLDESVKSAQAQSGVDFITNATFWLQGSCVTVEGTGAKVAGGSMPATESTTPKKKKK